MTEAEIKDYRKILEKEFMDKDLEIETSLSYISIGSLGFFITINQEFFKLQTACFKWILILSLIFLLVSFILILIRKGKTGHYDFKLMRSLDKMKKESEEDDLKIWNEWKDINRRLLNFRVYIYWCLSIGIGLQILFLSLNYL